MGILSHVVHILTLISVKLPNKENLTPACSTNEETQL